MNDSKTYFHPETIQRISRLELRSKYIVEGFLSGMHRSPFFGQSIEFRQHRNYVFGDDLRHVDWKVWARQDRLYVKQYEEDTNLTCHLLVDASESMSYTGKSIFSKYDYSATLAACLAYLVTRQKDRVSCTRLGGSKETIPANGRPEQLLAIASLLELDRELASCSIGNELLMMAEKNQQKGLFIILSDCFSEASEMEKGIGALRSAGHDVLLLHVLDRDEIEFPFSGPTHFEGMELDSEIKCNPASLRDTYRKSLNEFLHELRHICSRTSCDYELVVTDQRFNAVLSTLLDRRMARHKS